MGKKNGEFVGIAYKRGNMRSQAKKEKTVNETMDHQEEIGRFGSVKAFEEWVRKNGQTWEIFTLVHTRVEVDRNYDPATGMVCIRLGEIKYLPWRFRWGAWGLNNWAARNKLFPDFDPKAFIPKDVDTSDSEKYRLFIDGQYTEL